MKQYMRLQERFYNFSFGVFTAEIRVIHVINRTKEDQSKLLSINYEISRKEELIEQEEVENDDSMDMSGI